MFTTSMPLTSLSLNTLPLPLSPSHSSAHHSPGHCPLRMSCFPLFFVQPRLTRHINLLTAGPYCFNLGHVTPRGENISHLGEIIPRPCILRLKTFRPATGGATTQGIVLLCVLTFPRGRREQTTS